MRLSILILIIVSFSLPVQGQTPNEILKKSLKKVESIKQGYYEMSHSMKYMTKKDTTSNLFKCYFQKLDNDSIYSSKFHYKKYKGKKLLSDILYNGNEFISAYTNDSTATIMDKEKWATDIKDFKHNYIFFKPFIDKKGEPLPNDSIISLNVYKLVNDKAFIGKTPAYHLRLVKHPKEGITLKIEKNFWISKDNFIPLQYSIAYKTVINNDTMYQYERNTLLKYKINSLNTQNHFTKKSIPKLYTLKEYVPYKSPKLLPQGTQAPNWSLKSLKGKKISLYDLKGNIVLIDFFYKSCYPCLLAMPALQNIYEKYKNEKIKIIGIDPFDKKPEKLSKFLSKQGISYTVLLGNKELANEYKVSGYPTVYIIDKKGNILFSMSGYGEKIEKIYSKIINDNL